MTELRKRGNIPKALRASVWNTYIGKEQGTWDCFCGSEVSQLNFECGHVTPHSKGGPTNLYNLRPICSSCNKSMGNQDFHTFVKDMGLNPENYYKPFVSRKQDVDTSMLLYGLRSDLSDDELREIINILDRGEDVSIDYYETNMHEKIRLQHRLNAALRYVQHLSTKEFRINKVYCPQGCIDEVIFANTDEAAKILAVIYEMMGSYEEYVKAVKDSFKSAANDQDFIDKLSQVKVDWGEFFDVDSHKMNEYNVWLCKIWTLPEIRREMYKFIASSLLL